MATQVATVKSVKSASIPAIPTVNSVINKTVQFAIGAVPAADIIVLRDFLPKGVEVTGVWVKSTVAQGSSTFTCGKYAKGTTTAGVYTTGALTDTAFVTARTYNQTAGVVARATVVPGTDSVNSIVATEADLGLLVAAATTVAATITLTVQFVVVDTAESATTYTL